MDVIGRVESGTETEQLPRKRLKQVFEDRAEEELNKPVLFIATILSNINRLRHCQRNHPCEDTL